MDENQSNINTGNNNMKWILIAVAVIVIVALAVGGFYFINSSTENITDDVASEGEDAEGEVMINENVTEESTVNEGDETGYTDGTYTAVGIYSYHSGTESIEVALTLESGVITGSSVVAQAEHPTSVRLQDDFIANYESEVVGKNIDEVKLGKISGSSLTPLGFNAAVEDIRAQAQS